VPILDVKELFGGRHIPSWEAQIKESAPAWSVKFTAPRGLDTDGWHGPRAQEWREAFPGVSLGARPTCALVPRADAWLSARDPWLCDHDVSRTDKSENGGEEGRKAGPGVKFLL